MTDDLYDRITATLDDASTESGALAVPEDGDGDGADDDLLELAEEAADILEETDPRTLLEAVGLGTLEDGTEPETVPEAITKGQPDRVEELRRLVRLAKLADRSEGGELGDVIDGLREATGDEDDADSEADEEDAEADGDEGSEDEESTDGDENADETADEESTDNDEDGDGAPDGESTDAADELEERLRDAVGSSFEEFGADLESVRDQLAAAAGADDGSDEGDEEDGLLDSAGDLLDSEDGDGDEGDDDEEDDDDDDDDDGLLGSDDGLGSSDSSRYSTMAPPPNKRADMNAVKRHSTMPKRNR
ncbi:hypothetical protein GWG54_08805 [Natronococcus sp. JC468]|uniref:hypothetical protein n=1 Tax=Natronococcus sp. JC468 TaxID=1961921 RepID=UPI00143A8815|nr:hypothetical protein [Natronococcus sp. JC468]NKE35918.1 hypothetical protein [Natronococcus sp. JC468]